MLNLIVFQKNHESRSIDFFKVKTNRYCNFKVIFLNGPYIGKVLKTLNKKKP